MANLKEIQNRISSIQDTLKITNAMYLISSSKLRKARKEITDVTEYFNTMQNTISDILIHMPDIKHEYFDDGAQFRLGHKKKAYIVVTADKGLAGAYNLNVLKLTEEKLKKHPDSKLFVIGQIGTHYFMTKDVDMDEHFHYSSQNPTLSRSRSITAYLLEMYLAGEIDEVSIIFTEMKNAMESEAICMQLMPLKKRDFEKENDHSYFMVEDFYPSPNSVLNQIAPIYMQGIIFSALAESYCAELNDRMQAMDAATKNGKDMISELSLLYNRTRQGAITQEITEICAGARAQKKKA